ncbi:MAG TPA: hypothetical protein VK130_06905 [Steroidobacteraceae bacterium]|nr:hypothetical protein [Steroidobacteraceae bacterium]
MFADTDRDEREIVHELHLRDDARRIAERRELTIACYPSDFEVPGDPVELHLIEPGSGMCIAVRTTWWEMRLLLTKLSPIRRRQLVERATPCGLHPQPPTPQEEP